MKNTVTTILALPLVLLASCKTMPQTGTYHGEAGKLGTPTLIVRSDGTLSYRYGPIPFPGTWVAVTNMIIKAELFFGYGRYQTRFYALDKVSGSFRWAYKLNELKSEERPNHAVEPTHAIAGASGPP